MARFRRRNSSVRKPATAFAPGETRGKALTWEDLLDQPQPSALETAIPTSVRVVGAVQTRFLTLIPANVTRGVVTCERIRGSMNVWFDLNEIADNFENWFIHLQIQIVPVRDGAISTEAILSPGNSADQESNRIMWQRLYVPREGTSITAPGAVEKLGSSYQNIEIDVKSKRRFDRATWAMVLVYDCNLVAEALHLFNGHLRGLFRSADGL